MLAGGREKEEGGGEGGSGIKASAMMLHRGNEDVTIRYSLFWQQTFLEYFTENRQATMGMSVAEW